VILAVVSSALLLASCGGPTPSSAKADGPQPAGPVPSEIAKMPCLAKAQRDIAQVLGVRAAIRDVAWVDHRYSCRYQYVDGVMGLSVQELSSWSQTLSYFHALGHQLGDTGALGNLGQGAFRTSDGSIVVRKDWKVLLVDVSKLPDSFGRPPTSAADVGYTVADLILGCWAGD
jgi:hypothetical protein